MAEATQNGENLVKLSQKMVGKLRGFLKKVGDGLTTVPYVPGAVFEIAKLRKEEKQKTKLDTKEKASKNTKEEKTEPKKEIVENQKEKQTKTEPVISFGERVDQFVKQHVAESRKKKTATQSSEEVQLEKTKTIQGKSVADLLKDKEAEEVKEKEHKPAQPETVEIKPQVKPEPEKDKKEKKDLTDLTVFDSYEDYKYAFFWNYYINKKEFDSDQLDAFVKVLAKTADVKFYRTILTEGKFNAKKSEQEKEKEIDSIRKAEEEKNAKLDAERDAAIQKAKDDAQSTIDSLQDKLTDARRKKQVLASKLKVITEALASIGESSTTIGGIRAIDDAIAKANERCQGIDKRAAEREKERDAAIESEVEKKMADIYESLSGNREEVKVEKPAEDTKVAFEQPADQPQVVEAEKLVQAEESVQPEKPVEEERTVNLVFETPKEETEEVKGGNELLNEISDPTTFDADKFYMGFDPETRAEIGQEALERWKNSDNSITFDEAKEQVAQEYGQSKGRTR